MQITKEWKTIIIMIFVIVTLMLSIPIINNSCFILVWKFWRLNSKLKKYLLFQYLNAWIFQDRKCLADEIS